MIVFVVIFIIYSAFYLHNETVIQGTAYEIAIYGTTLDKSDSMKMQEKMQKKYKDAIDGRLISMNEPQMSMEVNGNAVTVSISGTMNTVSLGLFDNYNNEQISAKKTVKYNNPIDKIWVLKFIENLK